MGIYLSGSLTAYLGVLLGVSVIFINMTVRKIISFPAVFFIILSLFIMFFSAIYFADVLGNNPVDIENIIIIKTIERVRLYTVDSRLVVYDEAFQRILESPFLGVGFDQISTSGIARNNRYIYGTVHNAGIQVLYVGGVISFIGFVLIYLDLFVKSLKALFGRKSFAQHFLIICLAAATLAIILMDQFQDALYQREKWLMFGMFVSLMWPKLLDRKKEEMDNENC
jgi:O-antigen ligase